MKLKAKFLQLREQSFTDKEDTEIIYYRLDLYDADAGKFYSLPIGKGQPDRVKAAAPSFGEDVEITVDNVFNKRLDGDRLEVIEW